MSGAPIVPAGPASAGTSPASIPITPIKIKTLTICDFRAFAGPEPVTIALNGKNLLVFGENGAGKSTIFHALDEFFSAAQPNPVARKERLMALKNIFSGGPDNDVFVEVAMDDGSTPARWSTMRHPADTSPVSADPHVVNGAYRKAILDYRSLLDINYRHGTNEVNLFDVCVRVLLRDYPAIHNGQQSRLFDLWQNLTDYLTYGQLRKANLEAIDALAISFNEGLREAIDRLLTPVNSLLAELGWGDVRVVALDTPGITYNKATWRDGRDYDGKVINAHVAFRDKDLSYPQTFLNEARLSALALAIYFAGRQVCAATLQTDTPRIMVLDDVLIGLDQSNRLPVIDVLAKHFKDWQIILLTHDRVWFEMTRAYQRRHNADRFWNYAKIHSDDDPSKAPIVSLATSSAAADVLADGRNFLKQGHFNAAGNYARIAVELALREFCESKKVLVSYQQLPDKTPVSELLTAAKSFSTKANGTYDIPLSAIYMYTEILFNKLSHGEVPAVTSHEVQGAINAVDALLFALKVVPTTDKKLGK